MYQVTATRRRPQTFDELLGQEFVSATLKKSIELKKIANAYLFSGPRGCGKTSTARILAKAINCEHGPTASPCGVCDSCMQITNGSSFDVIEIDGASNTGVDDVRKLKDEILFPPHSSRYKVYIIDEVHMLSTNAFNALLKTIEEPPPYVVFIFATTELHKVPATIKSRCQQFNFKLVDIEVLRDALARAAAELGVQADDEALYWIAREGTGSVRDSYTLFDQVSAFSDSHITLEKIQDKLGLTGVEVINELVLACIEKNANKAISILHDSLNNGVSVEQFTVDCTKYFRSILLIKHGITKESVLGQKASRFSVDVLQGWQSVQIERALSIMLQLFKDIHLSVNPAYELELAISRLSWLSDYVPPNELKLAYDKLKLLLSGKSIKSLDNGYQHATQPQVAQAQVTQAKQSYSSEVQVSQVSQVSPTQAPQYAIAQSQNLTEETLQDEEAPPLEVYERETPSFNSADNLSSQPANNFEAPQPEAEIIRSYTIDELKDELVNHFSKTDAVLSNALRESLGWERKEGNLLICTQKTFHKDTIVGKRGKIQEVLAKLLKEKNIYIDISLLTSAEEPKAPDNGIPDEISQLMWKFQAQLIDVKKLAVDGIDEENGEYE